MIKSTEKILTWSLCYLVNGDSSGLTDEEIKMVDDFVKEFNIEIVSPIEENGEPQPEFSNYPAFGLATEVEKCIVIYAKK